MKKKELREFAQNELLNPQETLAREPEEVGPFVVALVELPKGGYVVRVAQPQVILANKQSKAPVIHDFGPWGAKNYATAARRFNELVDVELA